jgi:hypothetical protein
MSERRTFVAVRQAFLIEVRSCDPAPLIFVRRIAPPDARGVAQLELELAELKRADQEARLIVREARQTMRAARERELRERAERRAAASQARLRARDERSREGAALLKRQMEERQRQNEQRHATAAALLRAWSTSFAKPATAREAIQCARSDSSSAFARALHAFNLAFGSSGLPSPNSLVARLNGHCDSGGEHRLCQAGYREHSILWRVDRNTEAEK